jgi:Na+/H+ antiporter NhaD/arsenite permease-like protein
MSNPSPLTPMGTLIFAVTYLLISTRRWKWLGVDRPAAAMLGAIACVAFGVLRPDAALSAVDGRTLLLLFGVMGMGALLADDNLVSSFEHRITALAETPTRLLGILTWGCGVASAFITNDAVCVLVAPLVVRLIQRQKLPALPFLLAVATGANTGSVATLVGNPQNMLCGLLGGLEYREYLIVAGPIALLGLACNHAILWWFFRKTLQGHGLSTTSERVVLPVRNRITVGVILATTVAFSLGADLAWTAVTGFGILLLVHGSDARAVWSRIDWSLLLFFAGLFIVVEGFTSDGLPREFFASHPLPRGDGLGDRIELSALFLFGSNVVSNVPFILVIREQMGVLANPRMGWELLAIASTFAGNLTLIGSVANIIVAEAGRDVGGIGFWPYLRVGAPIAIGTTAIAIVWLSLFGGA